MNLNWILVVLDVTGVFVAVAQILRIRRLKQNDGAMVLMKNGRVMQIPRWRRVMRWIAVLIEFVTVIR